MVKYIFDSENKHILLRFVSKVENMVKERNEVLKTNCILNLIIYTLFTLIIYLLILIEESFILGVITKLLFKVGRL